MTHDSPIDSSLIALEPEREAANDSELVHCDSHLVRVPRFFYLDHLERFTAKRAPALLGLVGHHAYLHARDRHLTSFAEDAAHYAAQPTGVSDAFAFQAKRAFDAVAFARRSHAA